VGKGRIWVASRAAGVVSGLDPATGEIFEHEVDEASQVVIAGESVWAAGRGQVMEIASADGSGTGIIDFPPDVVDMAATDEGGPVWLVTSSGCVADVTRLESEVCANPDGFQATDVASTGEETWLLDGDTGDLHQLRAGPGVNEGRGVVDGDAPLPTAPVGTYADLLLTPDVLWVSGEGGRLMRLDLVTGEKVIARLDGDYADLAAGYGSVWALVGHEGGDRGELVEIDVATGEPTGAPYSLSGKPSDVYAGIDGVWVTLRDSNEVVRIVKPDAEPVPVETAEATPSPEAERELSRPLAPDELIMVFSGSEGREGETYAMFGDGRTEVITSPAKTDLHPSFVQALYSNGPAIVVERRDPQTLDSDLLYVDVPTGEETELVPGSLPAVSSYGQLAYWRMHKENPTLFITEIGTDFSRDLQLDGLARAIEWETTGRFVYVEMSAGHEDVRVWSYDSTGELGPLELDPGPQGRYFAPSSSTPDSVHLIRIESRPGEPVDSVGLVEIPRVSIQPDSYKQVVSLDGLGIDEDAFRSGNLRLEAIGMLDATVDGDGRIRWGIGEERSWIVGFRAEAWLVKESGEVVPLGEFAGGGLAISPEP
ncbi:MAG: hypothetical protein ACLGIB_06580, partial [Actinomycetota bacterium]